MRAVNPSGAVANVLDCAIVVSVVDLFVIDTAIELDAAIPQDFGDSYFGSCTNLLKGSSRGVVENILDWDIVISEFELQSHYYVHFRTIYLWERHEPQQLRVK